MAKLLSRRALMSGVGATILWIGCSSSSSDSNGGATGGSSAGSGVGGFAGSGGTAPDGATIGDWVLPTPLVFVAGSNNTFNLATTLPAGTAVGGTFAVDESGSPLPAGMTLSPDGVLSVANASAGDANGVVFSYTT